MYRFVLAGIAFTIPAAGLLEWSRPLNYDVPSVRVGIAVVSIGLLVGSWRVRFVHEHIREFTVAMLAFCFVWFCWIARQHGFGFDDVVGLFPILVVFALCLRNLVELGVAIVGLHVVLGAAYLGLDQVDFPFAITLLLYMALLTPLGWMAVRQDRLRMELRQVNADLERRIAARTAALVASEAAARAANAAKSTFLQNMSHELRTPLTAVLGHVELAREELEDREPEIDADLAKVEIATHHLLGLIDDLLDLTRVEAGQLEVVSENVPLLDVCEGAARLVRSTITASGNTLTIDVPSGLEVRADARRLRQVLVNLLSNAAKFTEHGTVHVFAERRQERVAIGVRDTGIGMAPEVVERVFDRFAQADDSTTRVRGGLGLGLAITRELITRMDGTIAIESEPGRGTTVWLELRLVD